MQFPIIKSIFYAEFHPSIGPQILFKVPEVSLDFDSLSEYIIPKPLLCNRLISFDSNVRVVGYPSLIQSTKYQRNALLFNLCFVFERGEETRCYEQILSKIARVLRSLEVESDFLSTEATKQRLPTIISQILEDLNSYHECQISINEANTLDLKLFPYHPTPPVVRDWQVPILLTSLSKQIDPHWDLTIKRIICFVNGVNSVDRIATIAEVDLKFVRLAIQHLLYYGAAKMIDVFQFQNIYACTSGINNLITDLELQARCSIFVARKGKPKPAIGIMCTLYCSLQGSFTILDWIREHPVYTSSIDIRRLVAFGLIHDILRRIHRYPIGPLDGTRCLDELCTKYFQFNIRYKMSNRALQEALGRSDVRYILK